MHYITSYYFTYVDCGQNKEINNLTNPILPTKTTPILKMTSMKEYTILDIIRDTERMLLLDKGCHTCAKTAVARESWYLPQDNDYEK